MWLAVLFVIFLVWLIVAQHPPGPRTLRVFDADRLAELELESWQAYYDKDKLKLFWLLVVLLREQYHYPWARALRAGYHLARAATTFGEAKGDYERVLPDLEAGYAIARDWTEGHFDPAAVARAELSWWTARREPSAGNGENKTRVVTERMTELYALLYEISPTRVAEAAKLRVDAADLRDRGAAEATPETETNGAVDWKGVRWLLHESYRSLHAAVSE
jgi:hypothetical protein